jgi:two-component system sensor histidine kinase DesK
MGLIARLAFPSVFLVYVLQTVNGISAYAHGPFAAVGYVAIGVFCVTYLVTLSALFTDRLRRFWVAYAGLVATCALEVAIAHQYAFSMFVFIGVPLIAIRGNRAIPFVAILVAVSFAVPALAPSWRKGADYGASTAIILLAMYAFFAVIHSNRALMDARAQIARLAADNERNRIARDLHDLLGHSLTSIAVKAALARRLATIDPERAADEIGQVEQLTRHALTEVRGAVAGYRDVNLAAELATGAEILRASGTAACFPDSLAMVDSRYVELFGWAAREALTNVVRHARATNCTVRVGPTWIEITDDGTHMTPSTRGSGLRGLADRAEPVGGRVTAGPVTSGGWCTRLDMNGAIQPDRAVDRGTA